MFRGGCPMNAFTSKIKWCLLIVLCGVCCSDSAGPTDPDSPEPTAPPNDLNIAIYTGAGVWNLGVTRIEERLQGWGFNSHRISDSEIIAGELQNGVTQLIVPGGDAGKSIDALGTRGIDAIREFVETGGGYIGICAGAYLAADRITWYGVDFDYPLDLMPGRAIGPLDDLADPGHFAWIDVHIDGSHTASGGLSGGYTAYYFDGPRFEASAMEFARYVTIDAPAAMVGTYGSGRYAVCGFHPEISVFTAPLLNGMIDWTRPKSTSQQKRVNGTILTVRQRAKERLSHVH